MSSWDPQKYFKNSSEQMHWAIDALKGLNLKGWEDIVDIGCGDGKITADISKKLTRGKVLGLDKSKDMIEFAILYFKNKEYSNLSFAVDCAEDLQVMEKFDVIVSFNALHWVQNHYKMLEGFKRILKENGQMLLQFAGKGNAHSILTAANEVIHLKLWEKYFLNFSFPWFFYGIEEYRCWLEGTGFTPLQIELVKKDMKHAGKEGLKNWIETTWLPYIERVPHTERKVFLNDIVDTYCRNYSQVPDSVIYTDMLRLQVIARNVSCK